MELIVTGKIKLINDTQTFASGFSKREFVVTTAEQYPQDIKFETIKDDFVIISLSVIVKSLDELEQIMDYFKSSPGVRKVVRG